MNYLIKYSDLLSLAGYFCSKFDYSVEASSGKIEQMGCAYIVLKNEKFPSIRIDMERYIFNVLIIQNEGEYIDLALYYKYHHPDIILHCQNFYRKKKNFNEYFYKDFIMYLEDYICNKNFDYQDMKSFYKKYPSNVWKWIDK